MSLCALGSRAAETPPDVELRRLDRTELDRVTEIDVSEEGSVNYRIVDGDLVVFAKRHRRPPFSAHYLRHRFVPVAEPHLELFALEPDDIHMAKPL